MLCRFEEEEIRLLAWSLQRQRQGNRPPKTPNRPPSRFRSSQSSRNLTLLRLVSRRQQGDNLPLKQLQAFLKVTPKLATTLNTAIVLMRTRITITPVTVISPQYPIKQLQLQLLYKLNTKDRCLQRSNRCIRRRIVCLNRAKIVYQRHHYKEVLVVQFHRR